jgi:ribonuclease P protein component
MLPKQNRADKKAIERIFKEGRFITSPNFSFRFIKDFGPKTTQMSFVVPKTVSKSAVVRNMLRRRGYQALAPYFTHFPKGLAGVFLFGKKSKEMFGLKKTKEYNGVFNIENEIKTILNKIN